MTTNPAHSEGKMLSDLDRMQFEKADLDALVFGMGAVFIGNDGQVRYLSQKEIYAELDNHQADGVE